MGLDETKIEAIAKVCHEANRAYCVSLGDDSQKSWEDAEEWQKESAIKGVKFHLMNPNTKPEDSHKSWMEDKEKDGWKKGDVKDAEKKEHPSMIPFAELPQEHQKKDHLFLGIVRALAW